MEVRRRRFGASAMLPVLFGLALSAGLAFVTDDVVVVTLPGLVVVVVTVTLNALWPFRFRIGADGLTMRLSRKTRHLTWSEIDRLVMVPSVAAITGRDRPAPGLLLAPAAGVDLGVPLNERSPVDDRQCALVLDFAEVRDTPEQVAEALGRFGGTRFVDLWQAVDRRFSSDFTIMLRGYDIAATDRLVADGQRALRSESMGQRIAAKTRIEATSLPVVIRGYNRRQVDTLLHALAGALPDEPDGTVRASGQVST